MNKNEKEYTNNAKEALYKSAFTFGERGEWWAMLMPSDEDSHSWPVSFYTRAEATAYMRRQFKLKIKQT